MAIGFINSLLGSLTGLMSNSLLILFTAIMMLLEAEGVPKKIRQIKKMKLVRKLWNAYLKSSNR